MRVELVCEGLPQDRIVVGQLPVIVVSGSDADVRIDGPGIDRYHCVIDEVSRVLIVSDLVSRGGTFVNDSEVDETAVVSGDVLRVGMASFEVRYERSRVPSPTSMEH